jgi:hypothetical protein
VASNGLIRIWLLAMVPNHRYGRWIATLLILVLGFSAYAAVVYLWSQRGPDERQFRGWPTAAFFVFSVAYIVPVFHYIVSRTQLALTRLEPFLPEAERNRFVYRVEHQSVAWILRTTLIAIGLWLAQSWLLSGSWQSMWDNLTRSSLSFAMSIGPLPVWLTMCAAMSALFRNALLFRRMSESLNVQLFEPDSYMPVGTMAVTSTLVVLGALGLLPIMWLNGPVSWWTTLPAMAFFSPLLLLLLAIPVMPVHRRLVAQRNQAIADAQAALRETQTIELRDRTAAKAAALSLRREVARLPTWPFDVSAITRFISYAIIVPLTWAGAALVEILVNSFVS